METRLKTSGGDCTSCKFLHQWTEWHEAWLGERMERCLKDGDLHDGVCCDYELVEEDYGI